MAEGTTRKYTDARRQISQLTEIGIALSAELNLDALLEKTLHHARELTRADAGTLYLLLGGQLHFKILHNESLKVFKGGTTGVAVDLEPVKLDMANVSAYAAIQGKTIHIEDVYRSAEFDFSGPRKYDKMTGYRSRSMLVVPMKNHHGDVIGVLQLINATEPETGAVGAFSDEAVNLAEALASQAAVAITNASLVEEIKNLFDSLIRVLATAIDMESPYTGNHVQRVAELNVVLAKAINEKRDGPFAGVHFTDEQLEEIRLAGWLHDVGKITTPVWIMDKATKLESIYDRIGLIETRFGFIRRGMEIAALEKKNEILRRGGSEEEMARLDGELERQRGALKDDLDFLRRCNQPGEFMEDAKLKRLQEIAKKTYVEDGAEKPLLTEDEAHNLSIRKGTLTEEQLKIMRDHVILTERMLSQIPFSGYLRNVPVYAAQHHERLDGKGYHKACKAEQLSLPARILAIADFYEALSAKDRPYKKPMSEEVILSILQKAADAGEIDKDVLELLTKDKIHHQFEEAYQATQRRSDGGTLKVEG